MVPPTSPAHAGGIGQPRRRARRGRARWQATLIVTLFFIAVAGAAGIGWWYARESPAHQGPIVLIATGGAPVSELPPYGPGRVDGDALEALAADAIVFERAYSHSPQLLPAHASILTGRLPFEHGVRDDAGFHLAGDLRTLPELLRSRGFRTGAAVSSFLLRPESGVAQGFTFFDASLPLAPPGAPPALERSGTATAAAAERWLRAQPGRRFFLFVQVDAADANDAVARLSLALKERDLYRPATILLVGDRGDAGAGLSLDDAALRVPLFVKLPENQGAGRRVTIPVQHIDLLPTILDLVRAPIPGGLRGRSLRPLLDDDDPIDETPIYSESLTAYYRFGGDPLYSLTGTGYRYVRNGDGEVVPLSAAGSESAGGGAAEAARLAALLDEMIRDAPIAQPEPVAEADEERFARLGYLAGMRLPPAPSDRAGELSLDVQQALVAAHREAAVLAGQKRYSAAIRALQAIVRARPTLAPVHYQIGGLLARTGRFEEAAAAFRAARALRPDSPEVAMGLAGALLRAGHVESAYEEAQAAVALAEAHRANLRAAAHLLAANAAVAAGRRSAAVDHAEAARANDERLPAPAFIRGRLLYEDGRYEEAAAAFAEAVDALKDGGRPVPELHFYYAESLARLGRDEDAELQLREELQAFPRNIRAYARLAMLYAAAGRDADVEETIDALVAAAPTPEGYAVATRLWTTLGERARAEALRSDARLRFRGDPSLALLGRDTRR